MISQGVIFLMVVASAFAQIPGFGRCPDVPVVPNFNVAQYAGKWYEIEKYFAVFEWGGKCITAIYTDFGNGTVGVLNSQIQEGSGEARSISGTARVLSTDGSAKLGVTFPSVPFAPEAPYWVIGTDYQEYAIVWSCNNALVANFQILWFLSRSRVPTQEVRDTVYAQIKRLGLNTGHLSATNQDNCE